jgi:hypothetical protein
MKTIKVPVYDRDDPEVVALVDERDAMKVFNFDWETKRSGKTIYAVSRAHIGGGSYKTVGMHNLVVGRTSGEVDHVNGNGLDNRRSNLRVGTKIQNAWNTTAKKNQKSSPFKGVTLHKPSGKWVAQICNNFVTRIGAFDTQEDAARAYDEVARETRGPLASFNFPRSRERSAITGLIEP